MSTATTADLEVIESMGVKLPIDPTVMSERLQQVIRAGEYEKGEAKHLHRIVEPGERVLELGAGIGFLSAMIGRMRRAESMVVVEANPALIPLIRITHGLNDVEAEVLHAAVVSKATTATLPFSLDVHFWASSLTPHRLKTIQAVVDVPVIALRQLVEDHRPTMVIIDVEGSEVELLSDLGDLKGVQKVLLEVHVKSIGPAGIKRLFDSFSMEGFYFDVLTVVPGVALFRRLPD